MIIPKGFLIVCTFSGGLICPTNQFANLVRQFDIVFASLHGTDISDMERVIVTLKETLCKKFSFLPEPIALKYSRFRTFTRYSDNSRLSDVACPKM